MNALRSSSERRYRSILHSSDIWDSRCEKGTYHIGEQRWLMRIYAVCYSLCCSLTQQRDLVQVSDQKP